MNKLQKYFAYRQSLIEQYIKGDMSKNEYLQENLNAVLSLDIKPFKNVDTVDKALFNYQYYNAMAKDEKAQGFNEKADYFYYKKDKATYKVLELIDYVGVEAYFIRVNSKYLKGKLFEIVLLDYNMILHSLNEGIINKLRNENIFDENIHKSLIDGYINQKY